MQNYQFRLEFAVRDYECDLAGMVIRIELDYLYSLRSGDQFYVGTNLERVSRLRFGFQQDIYLTPDEKPVLRANVIGTAVDDRGKPVLPKELEGILA